MCDTWKEYFSLHDLFVGNDGDGNGNAFMGHTRFGFEVDNVLAKNSAPHSVRMLPLLLLSFFRFSFTFADGWDMDMYELRQ